ncbi:MAG: hypothetical protein EA342_04775 [Leptolyngbya sp. LCM1.Bin17]|nr:MAG: hypothetical protein EA342_04775 [Leptolyngbya sp. LCM1.Bin17]
MLPVGQTIAQAEMACPHAILRLEGRQPVDDAAVCEAAQVWADRGYQVLVFLTDTQPHSEADWFDLLDQVEAAAGLRTLSQDDDFERRAIALEVTTATDLPFAVSVTYGEALFPTPLDTDPAALDDIKRQVRELIADQQTTAALVLGLEATAELASIDTSGVVPGALGWLGVGGGVAVMVGGGGTIARRRRRRQQRLEAQLKVLQARISNLLMGCEQWLTGPDPEAMVPYQLFAEAGGENYGDLTQQLKAWLRQARQALDQAFEVHATLQENGAQAQQPLAKRVEAWELLYLSFVGRRDRIQAMSDEELQTLLNPVLVLGNPQGLSAGLVQQLEAIQQRVQGSPLKVEITQADPSGVDQEGILGLVEQVDNTISRLREAMIQAPEQLAATDQRRQAFTVPLPPRLGLSSEQVLAGVDTLLAQADQALHQDQLYLRVQDYCQQVDAALEVVAALDPEFQQYDQRVEAVAAIAAQEYRPPLLDQSSQAMDAALGQVQQLLRQGHYDAVPEALSSLRQASHQAHTTATQWRDLHQQNVTAIQGLAQTGDRLQQLDQQEVAAAWSALHQYAPDNWEDLTAIHTAAQALLHEIRTQDLPQLQQQNSLAVQAFQAVEAGIVASAQRLEAAEAQFRQILDRWQLLQRAEVGFHRELGKIEAHMFQTAELVQPKRTGLMGRQQPDSRLQSAQTEVDAARHYFQAGSVLRACAARDQALRSVILAYADKVQEQGMTVHSLTLDHHASQPGRSAFQAAIALIPDSTEVDQATDQTLFQLYDTISQASQDLQRAERICRSAISNAHKGGYSSHNTFRSTSSTSRSSSSRSSSSSRRSSSSRGSSRRSSSGGSSRRR